MMNTIAIDEFLEVKKNIPDNILDIKVIEAINNLASLVCAEGYNKTPDFIGDKYRKKKKDYNFMSNIEFNPTIIKKNQGIEKEIDSIRILLNKLTEKSFDSISSLIKEKFMCIEKDFTNEECLKVGKSAFDIIINNILFSKIYAKLFSFVLKDFKFFTDVLKDKILNFNEYYKNEKELDLKSNLTFDDISEINKKIDKKKGEAQFFINLLLLNEINTEEIYKLISILLELFFEITNLPKKIYLTDQISDIMFIFIKDFYPIVENIDMREYISNNINYISNMKTSNRLSISNKCIFKFMDLKDEIKI